MDKDQVDMLLRIVGVVALVVVAVMLAYISHELGKQTLIYDKCNNALWDIGQTLDEMKMNMADITERGVPTNEDEEEEEEEE